MNPDSRKCNRYDDTHSIFARGAVHKDAAVGRMDDLFPSQVQSDQLN